MDLNFKDQTQHDSNVSRFTLDGVVAEMVIEVDEENESSQKTAKSNDFEKVKEANSPTAKGAFPNVCSESHTKLDFKSKDLISTLERTVERNINYPSDLTPDEVTDVKVLQSDDSKSLDTNSTLEKSVEMKINYEDDLNADKETDVKILQSDDSKSVLPEPHTKLDFKSGDTVSALEKSADAINNATDMIPDEVADIKISQSNDTKETLKLASNLLIKSENNLKENLQESIESELDQINKTIIFDKNKDEIKNEDKFVEKSNEDSVVLTNSPKTEVVPSLQSSHGRRIKATAKALDGMKIKQLRRPRKNITKENEENDTDVISGEKRLKKRTLNQQGNEDSNLTKEKGNLQRGNKRKLKDVEQDDASQKSASKTSKLLKFEKENVALPLELLKPKTFNLFVDGAKLDRFLHFKISFTRADLKYQRHLYRILFDKWAPNDVNQMRADVFQFKKFPFNKNSEEFEKRQHILKKLPDASVLQICKMFDLKEGKKENMISTILNFLLKPTKIITSVIDPFHSSMQPVVQLEKLSFGDGYFKSNKDENPVATIKRGPGRPPKKARFSLKTESSNLEDNKKKNESENDASNLKAKRKSALKLETSNKIPKEKIETENKSTPSSVKKSTVKAKLPSSGKKNLFSELETSSPAARGRLTSFEEQLSDNDEINDSVSTGQELPISKRRSTNVESSVKKKVSFGTQQEIKGSSRKYSYRNNATKENLGTIDMTTSKLLSSVDKLINVTSINLQKPAKVKKKSENLSVILHKKAMKNKIKDLKKEVSELKPKVDEVSGSSKEIILPTLEESVKNQDSEDKKPIGRLLIKSNISLNTEEEKSEDELSEITLSADEVEEASNDSAKKKKLIRCGKPLRIFKNIKDKIMNGNFSALQRLHILLFGASDKAENLKANILAFGGFPFLEGSDQWKQKEFLLSLLALNTLKEYLNLLCIDYSEEDDQQKLISKLMKFLAAPNNNIEKIPDAEKCLDIKTKVIRSELVQFPVPSTAGRKRKLSKKVKKAIKVGKKPKGEGKNLNKAEEKNVKVEKRGSGRKVLMDEAQVRRLEADIAREQRILEREKRYNAEMIKKYQQNQVKKSSLKKESLSPEVSGKIKVTSPSATVVVKQTDTEQLDALLQTVYKRRALKAAGAIVSTPNKGNRTKLGELPNVKFLVVTANYSDLDVMHHLIYMTDANKAKVRKNILDFSGFGFNEDSLLYKDRMEFLNSLGYDISKRIAFLLGLCPFKNKIPQQDLNELIMYFLMSPCKTKQVPITHLPQTFFSKTMPQELCQLLQKHSDIEISAVTPEAKSPEIPITPKSKELTIKKVTESITKSKSNEISPRKSVVSSQKAKKSFKSSCLPPVKKLSLSPSISTIPFKSAKPVHKKQNSPKINFPKVKTAKSTASTTATAQSLQKAILQPVPFNQPVAAQQEFVVQQQTPDGKKKTYKLIKLTTNQPLNSVLKPQTQFSPSPIIQTQPVSFTSPLTALPPGLIIFKSKTDPPISVPSVMPNVLQNIPIVLSQAPVTTVNSILPLTPTNVLPSKTEECVLPEDNSVKLPVECEYSDEEVETLNPLKEEPPTDDELYSSIQEIIHNANFEDITLRNVIDRVSAKYSNFDLAHKHVFMKECVKKIIIGS